MLMKQNINNDVTKESPIPHGLFAFEDGLALKGWGRGGGGGGVPAAHNSNINDNGMKFGGVVENQKRINLV